MSSFAVTTIPQNSNAGGWRPLLDRARSLSRPLMILGSVMLVTFLAALFGIFVDHRIITGVPSRVKPAKYAISVRL